MSEAIIVGLIAAGASIIVCIINNHSQNKKIVAEMSRNNEKQIAEMKKNNELQAYKLEELRKDVEKHNKVIERVYILEKDEAVIKEEIKNTKGRIKHLEQFHNG